MHALRRRLKTIPAVIIAVPLWALLSPIVAPGLVVFDLITGRVQLPLLRLWVFALVFCLHEWIGVANAGRLWITGGFGCRLDFDAHSAIQGWWATSLLDWARRLLAVHIDAEATPLPAGTVIVLSRHASMVDAIIPAVLFARRSARAVHYVMKRELQNIPNIDLYGHRLGNHFVDRGGDTMSEVAQIGALADHARPGSGLVIFPEGTYATAATKARIGESLRRRGDTVASALNDELVHLLPPKPAGTLSLLERLPDAPIVMLAHTGLEGVAELRGLRRHLPLRHPVLVRWWQIDRVTVPTDPESQVQWLNNQWRILDAWVDENRNTKSSSF